MNKMSSVTRLIGLAEIFEKAAREDETMAKAKRAAADLLRDHASDEKSAAPMVALMELIAMAAAASAGDNNSDED